VLADAWRGFIANLLLAGSFAFSATLSAQAFRAARSPTP
jgi:hypothetical protein